ncbi:hypothetical protein MLD38_032752 [Melastoma candidum]|uniref:Uncharacterized protein n=1 Tax=Melastoma candidum TaxID=119954 RepID=A0ACB9M6L0_9MYRT|nr:hypothetical protein MLD38_032752 [Melastoma candidum]
MAPSPSQSHQLLLLRQKTLASLAKLSDRDTFALATTELHSLLLNSLDPTTLPTFLSVFSSTLSSSSSPSARKHILFLLSALSTSHPVLLSPHLPSLVSPLSRLVRDPDSSVRLSLPSAVSSLPLSSPDHLDLLLRSFSESLFTEQDPHARVAAGACLAAVIDKAGVRSREDGNERLEKVLAKCEKAMRSEGWKGKVGVMRVLESLIGVVRKRELKGLAGSVLTCLGSEDWAERKAAAEVLLKLAHSEEAREFTKGCTAALEKRRFDKVKAVREVMNQALEAWKQVPDVISEISPPPQNESNGDYYGATKYSPEANSAGYLMRKRQGPVNQFTPPDSSSASTAQKRNGGSKSTSPALQTRKPWKAEAAVTNNVRSEADLMDRDKSIAPVRKSNVTTEVSKPETRRALFGKNSDENPRKFVGFRSGSRVAPCLDEETPEDAAVMEGNSMDDLHQIHKKEYEDLSMIRSQLLQIEKQQSSLLDLLQKFMGTSQNGMRSLETRVHGLELALDEISYDLAVTSGRMTNGAGGNSNPAGTSCCMLPGDFLSPKFWRKPEGQLLCSSRLTPSTDPLVHSFRSGELTNVDIRRFRLQGSTAFVANPLAKMPGQISEAA